MKKLVFESLYLVSHTEKKAAQFHFHPTVNVIKGINVEIGNSTGKSSLLKSLYGCFGADPAKQSPLWERAKVESLLKFTVDGRVYHIHRFGFHFTIFDDKQIVIGRYRRIGSELAPAIANLLGIGVKLPNRSTSILETPPPAFLFVPFYIDQDAGWKDPLASFHGLGQYARNWKESIVYYYIGLRRDEWYELQAERNLLEKQKEEPTRREETLASLRIRISKDLSEIPFDIDVDSFKREVDILISRCRSLASRQEVYRKQTAALQNERTKVMAQLEIIEKAQVELSEDYSFATEVLEDHVECPICGADYANDFAERFSLAKDEDRCISIHRELHQDLEKLESEITQQRSSFQATAEELSAIETSLNQKTGELTLDDLLKRESKKQMAASVDAEYKEVISKINEINISLARLQKEIRKQDSKDQRKLILDTFSGEMNHAIHKLRVNAVVMRNQNILLGVLKGSGSDLPRAVLAYYISLVKTIEAYGSGALCPLVIDSPNQHEQDKQNLTSILEYIRDHRPASSQLFLGLVEDLNIDFQGKIFILDRKYSLLSKEAYLEVSDFVRPFAKAANSIDIVDGEFDF
ncbi:MAG: hypothetical protein V4689_06050 [Verrucomicrobiota bacterium]